MNKETRIAVKSDSGMMVLDLQDFPHGHMVDSRKDDQYDIEFYEVPESLQVPSYNPDTCKVEWRHVKYWSVHRGKKLEIVTLSDGSQIYTDDDPRAIYGVACDAETLEPKRFTPSDAKKHNVLVPVSCSSFEDSMQDSWYDFCSGLVSTDKTEQSVKIGFSLGQFIGIMAGDGWSDCESKTYLADNEGYNIAFVEKFLSEVYPCVNTSKKEQLASGDMSRYGDTTKYYISVGDLKLGSRIKELVDGHGDENTSGSANKRLPEWFHFAGNDFVLGLVNGMIATDGTVALSYGKSKPQLRIQYTSTSLRLAREFQRCCRILGVRCSVSFSKDTSGGNKAWNCTVSTVDAKKANLLECCCHTRKRETFIHAEVETCDKYVKNDILRFPKNISAEIVKLIPAIKNPSSIDERKQQSLCIGVRKCASEGFIPRAMVWRIQDFATKIADKSSVIANMAIGVLCDIEERIASEKSKFAGKSSRLMSVDVSSEAAEVIRKGIDACKSGIRDNSNAGKMLKMLYSVRRCGRITDAQAVALHGFFKCGANTDLMYCIGLKRMLELASSETQWSTIDSIERTYEEVLGYDLTVPGYDTFMNSDGVILSNTVNIHVPASMKAANQAMEKMLPSKNLFSLTDMKSVRYKPEKEQISGLWALTRGRTRKPTRYFNSKADAVAAYRNGEIGPNDPIEIKEA